MKFINLTALVLFFAAILVFAFHREAHAPVRGIASVPEVSNSESK